MANRQFMQSRPQQRVLVVSLQANVTAPLQNQRPRRRRPATSSLCVEEVEAEGGGVDHSAGECVRRVGGVRAPQDRVSRDITAFKGCVWELPAPAGARRREARSDRDGAQQAGVMARSSWRNGAQQLA